MGTRFLPLFTSLTTAPSPFSFASPNPNNPKSLNPLRRSCIRSRPRAGPRYDSNAETFRSGRSKFSFDDDLFTDDDEDGFGFGFGTTAKRRRSWWSDDMAAEIDDDEDEEEEFSIFKVFRAFGWMVPAIGISMLLGTGPNALFMAIALPLGQSVVSLAIDKVWGRTDSPRPRPRSRTKKKPFSKTASNFRKTEIRREENMPYGKERESHPSSETANYRSGEKGNKSSSRFGGWDELEKQNGPDKVPRRVPIQKTDDGLPKQQGKGKLSRRARNRDSPLLLRLLIAVFPFLGSWTRLLL